LNLWRVRRGAVHEIVEVKAEAFLRSDPDQEPTDGPIYSPFYFSRSHVQLTFLALLLSHPSAELSDPGGTERANPEVMPPACMRSSNLARRCGFHDSKLHVILRGSGCKDRLVQPPTSVGAHCHQQTKNDGALPVWGRGCCEQGDERTAKHHYPISSGSCETVFEDTHVLSFDERSG
jgi:hypothetical protein